MKTEENSLKLGKGNCEIEKLNKFTELAKISK